MPRIRFDGRMSAGVAARGSRACSQGVREPGPVASVGRVPSAARRLALPALALIVALPPPAVAQDTRMVDQAIANQNIILRRYRPQRPEGTVEATITDQRSRIAPNRAAAIRFTLRSVTLEGNDHVPDPAFAPIWADRIGTTVTLADLYGFAAAVEEAYPGHDYFATAFVPVQDFAAGAVVIRVNETYVSEVEIASPIPGIEDRLAGYLAPITERRPIRVSEGERALALLTEVGGMEIKGTLENPQTPTGGAVLRVDADVKRWQGGVSLDNYGNSEVGPLQLSGTVAANDLFGQFETTSLIAVTVPDSPREMQLLQGSQDLPLGFRGLWIGYSLTWLDREPGGDLAGADIDLGTTIASTYLYYPLVKDFRRSLAGWVEFNARDDDIDVAGQPVVRDRARWIQVGLQYDRDLGNGALTAIGALAQGFGGLGANTGETGFSRAGVPDDYRFGRLDLDYRRPLGEKASLRLRAAGQYASDPLPGAVQFSVGGDPYGWAFTGHGIAGDRGAAAAFELAHDIDTGRAWLAGWQLRGVADYGGVWNNNPGGDVIGRDAFGSFAVGLAGGIGPASASVTVATPWLTPDHADDPGTGVFFSVAWGF